MSQKEKRSVYQPKLTSSIKFHRHLQSETEEEKRQQDLKFKKPKLENLQQKLRLPKATGCKV